MKSDNEFNCTMFRDNLRAFIDDELAVNKKTIFIDHASNCQACNIELHEMQYVKRCLADLERVTASSEFDFRLKSGIRREYENLRNPLYSFKLFINENLAKFFAVPAFAVIVIVGMILYNNGNGLEKATLLPQEVTSRLDLWEGVDLIPLNEDSVVEEVKYVLETVKPGDVERGIFLPESEGVVRSASKNELTLISY